MTKIKIATSPLLTEYAELSLSIRALEEKRAAIRSALVAGFNKEGVEKVESSFGTFSLTQTRTWKYSPALTKAQDKLKVAQIREQERGIAKASVTESIRFVVAKE